MQCLKIKDKIQLADILKQAIERFDENLDEIEKRKRGLGGGGYNDEVESCIVTVSDKGGSIVMGGARGGRFAAAGEEWWETESWFRIARNGKTAGRLTEESYRRSSVGWKRG